MKPWLRSWIAIAIVIVATGLYAVPARADTRSVGQTIVYDLTIVRNTKMDVSSLPAMMRAQAAASIAAANAKPVVYVVTSTIEGVDADGGAHVNVRYTDSIEAESKAAAVFAAQDKFAGKLTADGRFIATYDPNMPMTPGARGMYSPEQLANTKAQQVGSLFGDFNTFAGGCSKHAHFKPGDMWRVETKDAYGITRNYDFSVSASDTANGTDAPAVAMKGEFVGSGSSMKVNATGHYDTARQLVVDLHIEGAHSSEVPGAPASSGTEVWDFKLRP